MRGDVKRLKNDVSVLKTDVSSIKTDVSVLKTDVSILKSDVSNLKADLKDVRSVNRGMAGAILDLQEKQAGLATRKELVAFKDEILKRMDGFTALLEDSRTRWAVQSDVLLRHHNLLDSHDQRLTRIETPRA
ncbi:MAG: hypothetical protein HY552_04400 [Elusimicrobia bacterium]|nr:hypothetical protein [Elusimicrobiota bacterium]